MRGAVELRIKEKAATSQAQLPRRRQLKRGPTSCRHRCCCRRCSAPRHRSATADAAPPAHASRRLTLLLHVHGLDLPPVEDLDGHLVAGEDVLRHLDLFVYRGRVRVIEGGRVTFLGGVRPNGRMARCSRAGRGAAGTRCSERYRSSSCRWRSTSECLTAATGQPAATPHSLLPPHLAEGSYPKRLAQPVVGQEELGRLVEALHRRRRHRARRVRSCGVGHLLHWLRVNSSGDPDPDPGVRWHG
jgi:hypothetical protein